MSQELWQQAIKLRIEAMKPTTSARDRNALMQRAGQLEAQARAAA